MFGSSAERNEVERPARIDSMFGMSAERNEVERPARIDSGGTPPLRSLCTRKEAL